MGVQDSMYQAMELNLYMKINALEAQKRGWIKTIFIRQQRLVAKTFVCLDNLNIARNKVGLIFLTMVLNSLIEGY